MADNKQPQASVEMGSTPDLEALADSPLRAQNSLFPPDPQKESDSHLSNEEPEEEVKEPEEGEDLDLEGILGSLEEDNPDPKDPLVDVPPDFSTPEFAKLSEDFKKALGVDLKAAYEQYTQTAAQYAEMTARVQEMESRQTLSSLQDAWDVTPKELDRRVDAVLAVVGKMSDAQKAKYDSLDGIQEIWKKIEAKKATGKTTGTPSTGGQKPTSTAKRWKASEIRTMMFENPDLYQQNQGAISEAFRLGLVDKNS